MRDLIEEKELRAPAFLMVITGGPYAYRRDDDVNVVPVDCLRD